MKMQTLKLLCVALLLSVVSCDKATDGDDAGKKGPSAFSVLLPDDLEEIELDYNKPTKELTFQWVIEADMTYKVLLSLNEDLSLPVSIDLDASGEDKLTHAQLDKALGELGVKSYRQGEMYWAIEGMKNGASILSDARSMKLLRFFGPYTDARDGEVYRVARTVDPLTGDYMVWLADNVRATKYADGTAIPAAEMRFMANAEGATADQREWNRLRGGYYSWNATVRDVKAAENGDKVQGIAPEGWHIATRDEWIFLINTQPDNTNPAVTMKDTKFWSSTSTVPGNNASGLNFVAGGYIWTITEITHEPLENEVYAYFWTSTMPREGDVIPWNPDPSGFASQACVYNLNANDPGLAYYVYDRMRGMQVRCVLND